MLRTRSAAFALAAAIMLTPTLAACSSLPGSRPQPSQSSTAAKTASAPAPSFGPVYPAAKITDPLVALAVRKDAGDPRSIGRPSGVSTSTAVSAEIRGYMVEWSSRQKNVRSALRLAVMKDGTTYVILNYDVFSPLIGPEPRLTPESATEANARTAAVSAAQRLVATKYPQLAKTVPGFDGYLVRIHRADGSITDVWVSPGLEGAFWYNVELRPLPR